MFEHAKKRMDDPTTVPALLHADECVAQVQHWIVCGDWVPSKPIHTRHYEPSNGKLRDIDYVPFWPDGVMHWIPTKMTVNLNTAIRRICAEQGGVKLERAYI